LAALAVDAVLGMSDLDGPALTRLPDLLHGAHSDWVAALGSLDSELLLVLEHTRLIPDAIWQALARAEASA
jgi:chemotaxis signal transduction protein